MKIDDFIPKEEVISGNTALEVERCTSDYRQAKEDSLLFLLPGVSFDTYSIADKYASAKPRARMWTGCKYSGQVLRKS